MGFRDWWNRNKTKVAFWSGVATTVVIIKLANHLAKDTAVSADIPEDHSFDGWSLGVLDEYGHDDMGVYGNCEMVFASDLGKFGEECQKVADKLGYGKDPQVGLNFHIYEFPGD